MYIYIYVCVHIFIHFVNLPTKIHKQNNNVLGRFRVVANRSTLVDISLCFRYLTLC